MNPEDIRRQFELDYSYQEDNRDLANEDLRFILVPGGMWEGYLEDHYSDKPRMEYDMITQAVDRFMGEWSSGELMPKFHDEDSDDDDDDEAEVVDGLFRSIYRKEGGKKSLKNAVFEVAACGFGAVRLGTRYLDEYNAEDDRQEVTFSPVFDAHSTVVFDRNAKQIDKRDANHVSVLWEYTEEEFKRKWPDIDPQSFYTLDDKREIDWINKKSIFVLEYYEKKCRKAKVRVFMNQLGDKLEVEEKDLEFALPELIGYQQIAQRTVKIEHIEKSLLCGSGFIEKPRKVAGKILPIIPLYGYWGFVDGQERYFGLVRKQKDPSRILNMQVSNLTELAATSIKEAPIFDPEQVKGLEARWRSAHLGKKNYQLARDVKDSAGNIVARGPSGWIKPPQIDPATQGLIQFTTEHIRATTGGMPQDVEDPDASGKAILAVQKRVDMHTYTIMDNIASAIQRIGECFLSIVQEIYTDNRTVTTISEDGGKSRVQLNQMVAEDGRLRKLHDLSSKRFEVYVDVGPSYDSQRRETIEFLKELLVTLPEGDPRASVVIASIVDNMQGIGLGTIKKFNREQMLLSGIVEPDNEEEAALVMQAQQSQQQPEALEKLLESEAAKNMADAQGEMAQIAERMASAEKKKAEAAKIIESIGTERAKLLIDALQAQAKEAYN